jgi:hypothetical protein
LTLVVLALLYPIHSYSRNWYVKADGIGNEPVVQAGEYSSVLNIITRLANRTYVSADNRATFITPHHYLLLIGGKT